MHSIVNGGTLCANKKISYKHEENSFDFDTPGSSLLQQGDQGSTQKVLAEELLSDGIFVFVFMVSFYLVSEVYDRPLGQIIQYIVK
ncbi:MAG: hypothetical protein O3C21_00185 [Verrucomicrobia bacterium]|nr:hypothetical protein [Verrucomicrobiota bacterium]